MELHKSRICQCMVEIMDWVMLMIRMSEIKVAKKTFQEIQAFETD